MDESGRQESSDLEMSHSLGEVAEVKNGALERDLTGEIGDLRLRVEIDLDLLFQEISEIHEMPGNFRPEMRGGISEKGNRHRSLTRSLFVEEAASEEGEEVIGISIDAEGGRILKNGTMLHPGAGPATETGRGKCAMTESVNVISRPTGGRKSFEGSGRNAKEMIVSGESNLFVQTPEIRQLDNRRLLHLALLR